MNWSTAILGPAVITELKKQLTQAPDVKFLSIPSPFGLGSITVIQEEDAATRKGIAIAHSSATGQPVIYENDKHEFVVVHFPKIRSR